MERIIGIRPRVKRANGDEKQAAIKETGVSIEEIDDATEVDSEAKKDDKKSRSTMVAIKQGKKFVKLALKTDQDELDFALGKLPIKWRKAEEGEDLSSFLKHHIKESKKDGSISVPAEYAGFQTGDKVAMVLGGSGDRFAYALSNRGEEIGGKVYRLPSNSLKQKRGEGDKEDDHFLLANLLENEPQLFYCTNAKSREVIIVRELWALRQTTQKDRIACELRLYQQAIGRIFLSKEGYYPEGTIEAAYDAAKANSDVLKNLLAEEKKVNSNLQKAVRQLDVWKKVLEPIPGCGEIIMAGIIAAVGDIKRFNSEAGFKKFLGVHLLGASGKFARKRKGQVADWHNDCRRALYLLGDQFNRRPDSDWGEKLLEYKAKFREKHPEEIVDGKKKYGNGHIHKMALWRTLTKFAEWLYKEWRKSEA